jgi:phage terminase small subunit
MKASIKVQVNDRLKRLLEKEYSSVEDLKSSIKQSFDISQPIEAMTLIYKDDEEELFIMDENDLKAALWSAESKSTTLKINVRIEESQPNIQLVESDGEEEFEQVEQPAMS